MISEATLKKAVFFDRDGTLNVDTGYVHNWANFVWIPGAREAIKLVNEQDYLVFVVTNQSGIGRGYYNVDAVHALHDRMNADLAEIAAQIDGFEYCPHHPEEAEPKYLKACDCRKPAPGMILKLLEEWQIDPAQSLMIGDNDTDVAAAIAAKVQGHLFSGGNLHDFIAPLLQPTA
ncbi:MAG: D-glycero-beta-D-manno-heptose 1,7-bisphosphate 7-phosphatase [Alphaproteobacteria bacterium]|nr:D-glycero-beta-D-manno-heptose 1,7-bisphosphate 7-phosphatase [Alphaproteobacteria bacterium]